MPSSSTTAVMDPLTHRCNSCNIDVSPALANALLCPNCNSPLNPNPNPNQALNSTVTASDDNFLLDSPYIHRLIHHLTHSSDTSPSTITTTSRHHSPTSKSAIEAIPSVKISSDFLDIDPIVLCAVCKDQFVIDDEAKQLPCKHMYHPDCILPWLYKSNSCPVCRFEMPREAVGSCVKMRRRSRLVEDVDDEVMLGVGFRNLHQSEIGQTVEVNVLPDSDRVDGLLNVSGWRNWPVSGEDVDGRENVSGWPDWDVNRGGVDEAMQIRVNRSTSPSHTRS